MAREILFKAKRLDNGEWIEGNLLLYDNVVAQIHHQAEWYAYDVDPNTICQYTGLVDNDCNKIWENDIIGFEDIISYDNGYTEHHCRGKVVWDEETASFQVTERLSCESYEALMECDVIGNIFDNPELLDVLS